MNRKLRALLFDLDGTLIDTGDLHFEATINALTELGKTINRADYDHHIHGNNNADIAEYFFPGGDQKSQADYIHLKETKFRNSLGSAAPMPGLLDLLAWADEAGLKMGLVTNAPRQNKDLMLEAIGLSDRFDPVILGDDLPLAKPHPLPFLTALDYLGVAADQAIGFDDSLHGITAVQRAGMYGVGLTTGLAETRLKSAGADLCVADFRDPRLIDLLNARL